MSVNTTYGDSCVVYKDGVLCVANALFERRWRWTGTGFVTTRVASAATGTVWTREETGADCDWLLPGFDRSLPAELEHITAAVSDDEGFTSPHIEVLAEMAYPEAKMLLRYSVCV